MWGSALAFVEDEYGIWDVQGEIMITRHIKDRKGQSSMIVVSASKTS